MQFGMSTSQTASRIGKQGSGWGSAIPSPNVRSRDLNLNLRSNLSLQGDTPPLRTRDQLRENGNGLTARAVSRSQLRATLTCSPLLFLHNFSLPFGSRALLHFMDSIQRVNVPSSRKTCSLGFRVADPISLRGSSVAGGRTDLASRESPGSTPFTFPTSRRYPGSAGLSGEPLFCTIVKPTRMFSGEETW